MAAGHLVAHRELSLDGYVHLDHLDDAWRQIVAFRHLFALGFINPVNIFNLPIICAQDFGHLVVDLAAFEQALQFFDRQFVKLRARNGRARLDQDLAFFLARHGSRGLLAKHEFGKPVPGAPGNGPHMILFLLVENRGFVGFDGQGAIVLFA